ncbi:GGDEF family protein [Catenovulum agarivorans DS-2]|uniref:diguanylate cyclase n=1 Tax=Catenovulum agarivorans DS-2 TaxID=1328313 RepID=W7Q9W1_9ALTE|nr:GGDEF domain-containing protein [Catenovulum agarivorans]EWH08776.1 GGDEF family protein [Catenovulum agarivorans DS-2]
MNHTKRIQPTEYNQPVAIDDKPDGGISTSTTTSSQAGFHTNCTVRASTAAHAYCGILIPLFNWGEERFVSTEDYQFLEMDFSYSASSIDSLAISLINQRQTQGTQFIHYVYPQQGQQQIKLPLRQFMVPAWNAFDLYQANKPFEHTFTQANLLQVVTGDSKKDRQVTFDIHHIALTGKWLSQTQLFASILVVWGVILLTHLLLVTYNSVQQLQQQNRTNASLQKLNQHLKAQAVHFKNLAKYDELTGLLNRKGLNACYEQAIRAYFNKSQPYAMILLDIDHFKQINDSFGHDVGDDALRQVAKTVQFELREQDTLARWGGEELVIISPVENITSAARLAERIRRSIANAQILPSHKITASFGVAMLPNDDVEQWFKLADAALYRAKQKGRNRVEQVD